LVLEVVLVHVGMEILMALQVRSKQCNVVGWQAYFFCWDVVRLDKTDGVFAPNQAFFNGSSACGLCAEVRQQAGSWHCSKNEF
jgi:hypothetical protein